MAKILCNISYIKLIMFVFDNTFINSLVIFENNIKKKNHRYFIRYIIIK